MTSKQFLLDCAAIWERFESLDRIVDEIVELMEYYNVTFTNRSITTLTGDKGKQVLKPVDKFANDLFNDVDRAEEVERVCLRHMNFKDARFRQTSINETPIINLLTSRL